ncbi:hypothetical protein JXM67_07655 [candidate division WOR-3 bacterium]|nr:hypothetical protein [candidate division WOR-3 bacterium]
MLILAGVTTGYATEYEERWDGWFDTGTLYYNSVAYTLVGEATATVYDTTYSVSIDTFYYITQPALFLFISADNDSIRLSITVFRGYKGTGTSGTKEGTGGWIGQGLRMKNTVETTFTTVIGTWDTNGGSEYFDYNSSPPVYTAGWDVIGSSPSGLSGGGTNSGQRTYYREL